jgi:uncharacterized protein YbaR (Trm112 family)
VVDFSGICRFTKGRVMVYDRFIVKVISCPECKGEMQESHRQKENGVLYIWLECLKPGCKGQWLQKLPVNRTVQAKVEQADTTDVQVH